MNIPAGVDADSAQLGSPTATFSPPFLRIAIGALVMAVSGSGMLTTYFFAPTAVPGESEAEQIGFLVMGFLALVVAAGIVRHGVRIARQRIFVCPLGLLVRQGARVEVYPWDRIARVTESNVQEAVYGIPIGTCRAAVVKHVDGTELHLNRNRVRRVGRLIDEIQHHVWSRRSSQLAAETDPRLAQIGDAWSTLSDQVRSEIVTMAARAAAKQEVTAPAAEDVQVALRVTRTQIDRGDTVLLDSPCYGRFRIVLPVSAQHGTRLRLPNALPDQRHLYVLIHVND